MPCCLGCLSLAFPRLTLFLMWLLGYAGAAFDTVLWPVLGFLFMPYTTCAYAIAINEVGDVRGWGLACVVLGVILDFGCHGGSASTGHRYRRTRIYVRR